MSTIDLNGRERRASLAQKDQLTDDEWRELVAGQINSDTRVDAPDRVRMIRDGQISWLRADKDLPEFGLRAGQYTQDMLDTAVRRYDRRKEKGFSKSQMLGLNAADYFSNKNMWNEYLAERARKKRKRAGTMGTFGSIAGGIAGAMIGGPQGAMAGYQLGGQLGNYAGGGQSNQQTLDNSATLGAQLYASGFSPPAPNSPTSLGFNVPQLKTPGLYQPYQSGQGFNTRLGRF